MYRGLITPRRVAVLVSNLPRGAQTWIWVGGPMAVTAEAEATYALEYAMVMIAYHQGGAKGKKPEMREYPEGLRVQEDREASMIQKARAWRAAHPELTGSPGSEDE